MDLIKRYNIVLGRDALSSSKESALRDAEMGNMAAALCHAHNPHYFINLSLK